MSLLQTLLSLLITPSNLFNVRFWINVVRTLKLSMNKLTSAYVNATRQVVYLYVGIAVLIIAPVFGTLINFALIVLFFIINIVIFDDFLDTAKKLMIDSLLKVDHLRISETVDGVDFDVHVLTGDDPTGAYAYATIDTIFISKELYLDKGVFMHEVGHVLLDHNRKLIKFVFTMLSLLFMVAFVLTAEQTILAVAVNAMVYNITHVFSAMISRKHEYEADAFAANHNGKEELMRFLTKSGLHHDCIKGTYAQIVDTHPSVVGRLDALMKEA